MKVELPKLKRCCFCLPLRHGLIISGYLRLVLILVMFSFVVYSAVTHPSDLTAGVIVIKSLFTLWLAVDTGLTVAFLVGGHQKTTKLLGLYYFYNWVLLCLIALFFAWATGCDLLNVENLSKSFGYSHFLSVIQINILMAILFLGVQVYIILLIRSEIIKLKNSTHCRFDNLTVDPQCTLEDVTLENEVHHPNVALLKDNERGTERQFEGIINQTKIDRKSFN